jgi:hypothetical protein
MSLDWLDTYCASHQITSLDDLAKNITAAQNSQKGAIKEWRGSEDSDICYSNYKFGAFSVTGMGASNSNLGANIGINGGKEDFSALATAQGVFHFNTKVMMTNSTSLSSKLAALQNTVAELTTST